MAFKRIALVAIMLTPIAGGSSGAIALETKWAAPVVAGQPGYKEPPKVEEVHAPRPVKADPRYGGSYQTQRSDNSK